ncbi:hypothetical protein N1030_14195 [Desulfovibrio mangrovi]|uniref:hypothetical protein n=1 Tax=Desulfovibrio mangrovi TaxID=2976983 RepID=UPI0022464AFE|nr:hypothetical protein [Desulfovibrio mangrovi]UZP66751.1 hypothetical protein N1030_14195 [Desulfovibrio mangrovi]
MDIYYLFPFNISQRDCERFGIDAMIRKGFRVHVLVMSRLFYSRNVAHTDFVPEGAASFIKAQTMGDVRAAIATAPKESVAISYLGATPTDRKVLGILKEHRLPYVTAGLMAIPVPNFTLRERILRSLKSFTWKKAVQAIQRLPFYPKPEIDRPVLILGAGKFTQTWFGPNARIAFIHALDYDQYLKCMAAPQPETKTAVFLDQYFPYHPEAMTHGSKMGATPDDYYPKMCRLFDAVEKQTGLRVTIAAHPRSEYEKHPGVFGDREIIKGMSAEMISRCKLVILHNSTSVSFAALFGKPMLFATTSQLENGYVGIRYFHKLLDAFRARALNMDVHAPDSFADFVTTPDVRYREFIEDYIKVPGTAEKPFWDAAADLLTAHPAIREALARRQ